MASTKWDNRILVVDDEPHARKTLTVILERAGYEAESADNGREATKMLSKSIYNLVFSDFRMPDVDGMQVLHALNKVQPDTPLIMITAHGTIENAASAMHQGASDYITKPYNAEELLIRVERATRQKQVIEENKHLKWQLDPRIFLFEYHRYQHFTRASRPK